jgi:hypothetical protein
LNLQPSALETDALPLSYSPKELAYLAAFSDEYTSAVCAKRTCTLNAETWQEDNGKKPGSS